MSEANGLRIPERILLVLLTLYALGMIAPDFARLVRPLGSFGLTTNADGLIYDVRSPFETEADSPAYRAGLRVGERLDLWAMRCVPVDTERCASNLALWGGVVYAVPGRRATLTIAAEAGRPAREVDLTAVPGPRSIAADIAFALAQVAAVLVVLGAAWLVWIRPGPMTWGFFVYVLYFNPGLSFQTTAWLQQWPPALMAQAVVSNVLQAAAYAGLLLFALRAPVDRAEGRWRRVQRALPAFFGVALAIELASLASLFGFRSEYATRLSLLLGFAVSAAAIAILLARRADLSPRDYQRIRWVIWGCLIGLPATLIGEIWRETSLPDSLFGAGAATDELASLLYLVNGVLCLFVVEAVRRPTVVSVWIPLRRATILGLLLSLPVFLIHESFGTVHEWAELPEWAWLLLATVLVFALSRLHEWMTEWAERILDSDFRRAERRLEEVGREIARAESLDEIERLLVEEPAKTLKLASAAVFRREEDGEGGRMRRQRSVGWGASDAEFLAEGEPPLPAPPPSGPFSMAGRRAGLPDDLARPIFGVPIANARRRFAVVLYSGHEAGTDLHESERDLLGALARDAETAYGQVERELLQQRIERLEGQLREAAGRA
ncbi:hypothetical protein DFR50_114125 [Roseiarcus fermentans]|uniref:GAF domain-containing protein n=1 Tax=Roseiarcus fermentans TaxID=1473586 RepID=A0A366FEZ2_9HYPH|nr:hypothetical protein [Roseiarcus fermentans]RBP12295.1 hypothetical protein DFR50_114125 [Roseiarcus fermentans]